MPQHKCSELRGTEFPERRHIGTLKKKGPGDTNPLARYLYTDGWTQQPELFSQLFWTIQVIIDPCTPTCLAMKPFFVVRDCATQPESTKFDTIFSNHLLFFFDTQNESKDQSRQCGRLFQTSEKPDLTENLMLRYCTGHSRKRPSFQKGRGKRPRCSATQQIAPSTQPRPAHFIPDVLWGRLCFGF